MSDNPTSLNRRVVRLAVPIMIANLSLPLLGAVDTAVMGHLPDPAYLGGVAIGGVIFQFIYWGFGFLRMGTTGLVAQAHGAGAEDEKRAVLARAMAIAVGLGALVIVLQIPILFVSLQLFQASPEVESLAGTYFHIRVWSAPAALANYAVVGWLIGAQDTRRAMMLQVGMNGLNIALDLLFVIGLGWGVAGVASATAIAEYTAAGAGIAIVSWRYVGRPGTDWLADLSNRAQLKRLFVLNRDIFIRTLCLLFSFAYLASEAGRLGDVALAANAVMIQFQGFLSYGLDGFAHASEALVGGALGARDRSQLRAVVMAAGRFALLFALGYAVVYASAGWWIVALLTSIAEVQAQARALLPWAVAMPLVAVWPFLFDGIFIGATFTREMRNGMALALAVYLISVWTLGHTFGLQGLWASMLLFMAARGATLAMWYPRIERAAARSAQ